MDAPPIQYARTEDGVNIAYWTLGDGPPLVVTEAGGHSSHVAKEWEVTELRRWYEALAERWAVIRLDVRGYGLSDGAETPFSVENIGRDLSAVIEEVGPPATVLTRGPLQRAVLALAARRPDLVSRLVLFETPGPEGDEHLPVKTLAPLQKTNPELYRDTLMFWVGWADAASRKQATAVAEASAPVERVNAVLEQMFGWQTDSLRAELTIPVLVLHRRNSIYMSAADVQDYIAPIPDARLVLLDGHEFHPALGNWEQVNAQLAAFVPSTPLPRSPAAVQTLLFTDLESSTALTQAVGDEKAQKVLDGHDTAVRAALAANGGEEVKHLGDGIFAAFTSAVGAVEAALQIQRELAGAEVRVRIGLNAGEPIAKDDDYFGSAVQLAARVCDRAEPGQVLVPQVVRDLCRGKTFTFEDQGEATLKGFPEPVRLFAVGAAPP